MSGYYGNNSSYGGGASTQDSSYSQQHQMYYSGGGGAGGAGGNNQANYSTDHWQQQHQSQAQQGAHQYNHWQPQQQHQQQAFQPSSSSSNMTMMTMQQHQQQPQQPQYAGWDPSAAAASLAASAFSNNPGMAGQMVQDMSASFLRESWAKMIPGLEAFLLTLRAYFAVDNKYVLQKIKCILFPFLKKDWHRNLKGYGGPDGSTPMYDLPIADENAPDLYLPFMSLITYVLLAALVYGNAGKFSPEVIPDVTTKCLGTQVLEMLCMRLGIYMLLTQQQQQQYARRQHPVHVIALLDLLSYTGYKYLGLSVNMFFGLIANHFDLGARVYYITFLWTASAASFFMLKTMTSSVPAMGGGGGGMYSGDDDKYKGGTNRQVMILVFAAAQFATMWFVSQTKNL